MPMAQRPPPVLMTMRILWGALLGVSLVAPAIGFFARQPENKPIAVLPIALGVASLIELGISQFWVAQQARIALQRAAFAVTDVPDPNVVAGFYREQVPTIRVFADPDAVEKRLFIIYQTSFILRLALRESIAMYAVVLGTLGHPVEQVVPFAAVAFVSIAIEFPTRERVIRVVERAYGARMVAPTTA